MPPGLIKFLRVCRRVRAHPVLGCATAVCFTIIAFFLQLTLDYHGAPFLVVYPAFVLATLLGGLYAGLLVAAVDGAAQWLYFIPETTTAAVVTYALDVFLACLLLQLLNRYFDMLLALERDAIHSIFKNPILKE